MTEEKLCRKHGIAMFRITSSNPRKNGRWKCRACHNEYCIASYRRKMSTKKGREEQRKQKREYRRRTWKLPGYHEKNLQQRRNYRAAIYADPVKKAEHLAKRRAYYAKRKAEGGEGYQRMLEARRRQHKAAWQRKIATKLPILEFKATAPLPVQIVVGPWRKERSQKLLTAAKRKASIDVPVRTR